MTAMSIRQQCGPSSFTQQIWGRKLSRGNPSSTCSSAVTGGGGHGQKSGIAQSRDEHMPRQCQFRAVEPRRLPGLEKGAVCHAHRIGQRVETGLAVWKIGVLQEE